MALTDKQEMFCREYLIDLNATQAAIRTGYSENTARKIGSENLTKPDVQNRIPELKLQRNEQVNIDAAYVLRRLVEIDQMDFFDIVKDNPKETASLISKRLDVSMSDSKNIAQTEQVGALRKAQWSETTWSKERLGLNPGLLWLSALNPTTRAWHAARHGKVYTVENVEAFYAENGNRYHCYCSQIPAILNDKGDVVNEGLSQRLADERKKWQT